MVHVDQLLVFVKLSVKCFMNVACSGMPLNDFEGEVDIWLYITWQHLYCRVTHIYLVLDVV